ALIARADEHGLNPERYHSKLITDILANGLKGQEGPATSVVIEILISNAVMRYAYDMRYGVAGRSIEVNTGKFVAPLPHADILAEAASAGNVENYLRASARPGVVYEGMKSLLLQYRALEVKGGWPAFGKGKKLSPGETDARVGNLRKILFIQGDLPIEGEGN